MIRQPENAPENGNGKRWGVVETIWKALVVISLIVSATFFMLDRMQNAPLSEKIVTSQARQDSEIDSVRTMCVETKGEVAILKNRVEALFQQVQVVSDRQGTVRESLAALKQEVDAHERQDQSVFKKLGH